jgi:GT2 family glycosyltransferase
MRRDLSTVAESRQPIPPTSLIICSRNRQRMLLDTVASILDGEEVPTEIIVVDQSDSPSPELETHGTVRGCDVHYQWTRGRGVSRSRNHGIAQALYDVVVIADDDMYVDPAWFGSITRALLRSGPKSVITGRVLESLSADGSEGFAPSVQADLQPIVYSEPARGDPLSTGNMAAYRSAVEKVGLFDVRLGPGTRFPSSEDNDLGYRLLRTGYSIVYAPEAVVYHRAWRNREEYVQLQWNYGRGQGAYYAKHLRLRDAHMLRRLLHDVGWHLVGLPYWIFRNPYQARLNASFAAGIASGAVEWLLTQRVSTLWHAQT